MNTVDPPFEAHGSSTSSSQSSSPQLSSDENVSSSSGEAQPPSPMTLRPRPTIRSNPEASSQSRATTRPKVTFNPVKKVRTFYTVPYSELEASLAADAKLPSASSPHIPNSQLPGSLKRTAIKQSILRNRTSSTPSRATQLDQVRASIQKYATGQSSTASSKPTLDPDSSLNSLVTPETNHVTLVDAFISRSPSPIIRCIAGDHFLHSSHNDSFLWLNKPWDASWPHYQAFPIGTVIPIFDRYGYPVLFYLVTRDLSFQPDDPQTLMSAFTAFFSHYLLF